MQRRTAKETYNARTPKIKKKSTESLNFSLKIREKHSKTRSNRALKITALVELVVLGVAVVVILETDDVHYDEDYDNAYDVNDDDMMMTMMK